MTVRQTVTFMLIEINGKRDFDLRRICLQQSDPTRFYQTFNRRRSGRPKPLVTTRKFGLIVRDERAAKRHKLQSERGFSAARPTHDQQAAPIQCDRRGMYEHVFGHRRSDRQTHDKARTKRLRGNVGICRANVFGPDHTAMRLDNLFGDRQS